MVLHRSSYMFIIYIKGLPFLHISEQFELSLYLGVNLDLARCYEELSKIGSLALVFPKYIHTFRQHIHLRTILVIYLAIRTTL